MQNNSQFNSVSPEALERKHETREPHLRNVLIIGVSVALMIMFCFASAGILIAKLSKQRPMQSTQPLGIISAPNLKPLARFPKPNLEIDDGHGDLTELNARQNFELNSYGWIDRSNGIVRIPIDRAMDLILQRGLSTRTNSISQTDSSPLQLIQERPEQK
jgi:hypothetical protein